MSKLELSPIPDVSRLSVDFAHPNRALFCGCFLEMVTVQGMERTFYTYIPEGLEYCQPCLVVAPPAECEPLSYMETSGFRKFAEKQKVFLHFLIPVHGSWDTDGSDADYMNAVYAAIQRRDYYVTMQDNIYACGIGDGAAIAHQAAQRMTSEWSGLFSFGRIACNLSQTQEVMASGQEQNGTELRIDAEKTQLPVWIAVKSMDELTAIAVDYWKEQNHVIEPPLTGYGAQIWMPSPVRKYSEVNEERISQVRLTLGDATVDLASLERMWSYIGLARRHRSYGQKDLRYFKRPGDCGAVLQERGINGMARLWYEYVPESCTSGQRYPLVVVMHGRGGTAETFFDISGMSQVAEARKFIAVFPQAGIHQQKPGGLKNVLFWNGSYEGVPVNDVEFIRTMILDIEKRLPIDPGRVYACGQSSGGIMADVLNRSASDLFTACASWSGMYHPRKVHSVYERTEPVIPTLFICGANDTFCMEKGEDSVFPFHLIPELRRDIEEKIASCRLDMEKMQTWTTDPITWYCYPNDQGVPMLTVGIVRDMAHANYPEESWITYDQFFSNFSRDDTGRLLYRGRVVETK